VKDPCQGYSYEGCCDGQILRWCENDTVNQLNCGNNPYCGWSAGSSYYNCSTSGGEDPSGDHPKNCDGSPCVPDCSAKECGSDGCGGSCGDCVELHGSGWYCSFSSGKCYYDD